jgi:hypothetical protein
MKLDWKNVKRSTLFPGNYMGNCVCCGATYESEKRNPKCDDCWNAPITQLDLQDMFGVKMPVNAASEWAAGPRDHEQMYHLRERLAYMAKAWKEEQREKYGTRIVAAALRVSNLFYPNGEPMLPLIVTTEAPGRHHNAFHAMAAVGNAIPGAEQGFITDKGVFVDRDTAGWIATEAKQLLKGGVNTYLFSEDLW